VIGGNDISSKTAAALAKSVHGATVTIIDVLTYSLQSYKEPESDSTIWALGYAAWYSILPAPEYRKYFDRSLEKAHIWDIVLEFGKSQEFRQVTMEQLFAKVISSMFPPFPLQQLTVAPVLSKAPKLQKRRWSRNGLSAVPKVPCMQNA